MGDIFGAGQATAGLLGAAGSIIGGAMSYRSAKRLQQMQNDFTERMSNTAYQRGTSDMRAAGLNPALMYGSGSAASTPVAGNSSGVSFDNPGNSAMAGMQARASIENVRANTAFAREQAKTEANKRENLDAETAFKNAENIRQDKHLDNETRKTAAEVQELIARSELNEQIARYTGYNAETGRISANAASTNAGASVISAKASMINATEGNPFKYGKEKISSFIRDRRIITSSPASRILFKRKR